MSVCRSGACVRRLPRGHSHSAWLCRMVYHILSHDDAQLWIIALTCSAIDKVTVTVMPSIFLDDTRETPDRGDGRTTERLRRESTNTISVLLRRFSLRLLTVDRCSIMVKLVGARPNVADWDDMISVVRVFNEVVGGWHSCQISRVDNVRRRTDCRALYYTRREKLYQKLSQSLNKKFNKSTVAVKTMLFRSYCICLYDAAL